MRISMTTLSLAALLLAATVALPLAGRAADDPAVLVKKRIEAMKENGRNLNMIVAVVRGKKPFDQTAVAAAKASWDYSKTVLSLFPPGSVAPESRAMPEIWSKPAEFKQAIEQLEAASHKLYEITMTGDVAAMQAQLKEVGAACSNCHDKFRKPNE